MISACFVPLRSNSRISRPPLSLALVIALLICANAAGQEGLDKTDFKPHAVFIVGTHHYSPQKTMPRLAKQLERNGFKVTVVLPDDDPEHDEKRGVGDLSVLKEADVVVLFLRFLTLPDSQMRELLAYVQSGKPVVGFRTTTHAFDYPSGHPYEKWNNGFGKQVLGTKYSIHLKGSTQVSIVNQHEVLLGVDLEKPRESAGTLYLADLPSNANVILHGTGKSKRKGSVTNRFGTIELKAKMTSPVAWTWKNVWGGRVFSTSLGHLKTFEDPNWVRFFLNGIHWAAGEKVPSKLECEPIKIAAVAEPELKLVGMPTAWPDGSFTRQSSPASSEFDELMALIQETIEPDTWLADGRSPFFDEIPPASFYEVEADKADWVLELEFFDEDESVFSVRSYLKRNGEQSIQAPHTLTILGCALYPTGCASGRKTLSQSEIGKLHIEVNYSFDDTKHGPRAWRGEFDVASLKDGKAKLDADMAAKHALSSARSVHYRWRRAAK